MNRDYVAPELYEDSFNCPHCNAFAHQLWSSATHTDNIPAAIMMQLGDANAVATQRLQIPGWHYSMCQKCHEYAFWVEGHLIYPAVASAPMPNPDMPENVKEDYLEARNIANASPRGAAALLRLAVQKLMPHLGEKGEKIDADIASLVKKGLPVKIQQLLDTVRVIGNEAVHPGEINLNDNPEIATGLFTALNMIIDRTITEDKQIDDFYSKLPPNKRDAIDKRDGNS